MAFSFCFLEHEGETCILARRKRKSKPNRIYTLTPKKVLYIDTEVVYAGIIIQGRR